MSIFYEKPLLLSSDTFAGGEASLASIYKSDRENTRLVENINSAYAADNQAYKNRIDAIFSATGVALDNPHNRYQSEFDYIEDVENIHLTPRQRHAKFEREFADRLVELTKQFPQHADVIGAGRPIVEDAKKLAREANEIALRNANSRNDAMGFVASLGGSFHGMLHDPINVLAFAFGGGANTARSAVGRIAQAATREAMVNAAYEAGSQPFVQAWRKEVGLPHGLAEALRNVTNAAAFGGAFGGGFQIGGEVLSRLLRQPEVSAQLELSISKSELPDKLKRAAGGDLDAAVDVLAEMRDGLSASARGAYDFLRNHQAIRRQRPKHASPARHEQASYEAEDILTGQLDKFSVDQEQVSRIVRTLEPGLVIDDDLVGFVISEGGLKPRNDGFDFNVDGLINPKGLTDEQALKRAIDAGFFDQKFINRELAHQDLRIADLEDALSEQLAGKRVRPNSVEAGVRQDVEAVIEAFGPQVSDELVAEAVKLVRKDGIEPSQAVEQVTIKQPEVQAHIKRAGLEDDPILYEGMRINAPEPNGIDDPGRLDAAQIDLENLEATHGLNADGELVDIKDLVKNLDRELGLARFVGACRA